MIYLKNIKADRKLICGLSAGITLLILVIMMILQCVTPFGDNSLLIIDGLHQYMPFFSVLYDKLKTGGSLFYSFRSGLGINFLALFSYYLSSPLNLFILLFKKTQLNTAVSLLVVLKLVLSALCASIYFCTKVKKPGAPVVMVSVAYALNAYMVGYCWNVMWLDSIMIFPLIILGIERLINKRDGRLYGITLFYALYCNYYIAFMICIFAVLWYMIYNFKNFKQFFFRGLAFTGWSFLAAGMSAVLLIPAYAGIKQTASGDNMTLPSHEWLTDFWSLITRQYDLSSPITHDNFDGNINLYMGTFAIFCILLYFLNKRIDLFEKLKYLFLILIFYLSFCEKQLNFIWHGFHDQYGIPNRFSFLFIFMALVMVLELFEHTEAIAVWQVMVSCIISIGMMVISRLFVESPLEDGVYGLIGMMLLLYTLVLFMMNIDKKHRDYHVLLFCMIAVVEIGISTVNGFTNNGQISISKYFYGVADMDEATKQIKEENDMAGNFFYRSELAKSLMVDENALYDMNTVGLFGSTAKDTTVDIMDSLGFYTGCNEYLYRGANPVSNAMLGVKYLYFHDGDELNTKFLYKDRCGSFEIFENPVADLSIGAAVDHYIDNWYYYSDYPFTVLNDFCYQGYDTDGIFDVVPIDDPIVNGCSVENTNDGEYRFDFKTAEHNNLVFALPAMTEDRDLYVFYDGTQVRNVEIAVNGQIEFQGDVDGQMQLLPDLKKGDVVTLAMELKGETLTGYVRLSAATFNQELFEQFTDRMSAGLFHVEEMSDTHIKGKVTVGEDQYVYFSIPYDEGWRVFIDGYEQDTFDVGNAFLAVATTEGEHEIELNFTPPGYAVGSKISFISLFIFLIILLSSKKLASFRENYEKKKAEEKAKKLEESLKLMEHAIMAEDEDDDY